MKKCHVIVSPKNNSGCGLCGCRSSAAVQKWNWANWTNNHTNISFSLKEVVLVGNPNLEIVVDMLLATWGVVLQ